MPRRRLRARLHPVRSHHLPTKLNQQMIARLVKLILIPKREIGRLQSLLHLQIKHKKSKRLCRTDILACRSHSHRVRGTRSLLTLACATMKNARPHTYLTLANRTWS
jgi:hypothetical protein